MAYDLRQEVDIIYTDLEKAFDKISHDRLLFKLKRYGIHPKILTWIKNYLVNRHFAVRVSDKLSDSTRVTSGVPQGSVLGPLLFIIYINDLQDVCNNVYLFADDAKIFRNLRCPKDSDTLQEDINHVMEWFEKWHISVNISKCCLLRIGGNSESVDYMLRDSGGQTYNIPVVDSITDLGVIVDSQLNFKEHILAKTKKAGMLLGIIARNFKHLSEEAFVCLYKSLVRSQLEYAVQVWNPYRMGLIAEILRIQRRATKLVRSCKNLSYVDRLKKLKLPSLAYRRIRADMIMTYKITRGYFLNFNCPALMPCPDQRTRGHSWKLVTGINHRDCRKHFFSNRVVRYWNNLPEEVVDASDLAAIKALMDAVLVSRNMRFS